LNIKNEDTHRLARELAALTGESMTVAVTEAIRERIKRVKGSERKGLSERLLAIGRDCAVSEHQAYIARQAYRDYGRGSGHPTQLNVGDCFAYALARATGEPLLSKGDDFQHIDIAPAVG